MSYKALLPFAILTITGCSSYQMNQLGLRSSPVNSYPNYMSTIELCEVANGYRSTNQTRISVSSEQWKRKLSAEQCDELVKELYVSRFIKSIKITKPKHENPPVPTPLPAGAATAPNK
ncbi:hypothetical protein ACPV4B_10215 [Vibrio parahaemolyticus]|uniref:hypothetical protein n=1 Tax=Vibrio mediterranei TaxID=689 RepID=UPI0040697F84